jgi:alpha-tubulin suppressor-like RCC1 family protein
MPRWLAISVLLSACSQTFEVLGPEATQHAAADAGRRRDAGAAHDAAQSASDAAPNSNAPCELCAADELCSIDACVPARGPMALASCLWHSCEVERGRLYCWGNNENGQLGVGDQTARTTRTRVGSFNDWLSVAVGEQHSCAIRAPGRVYCWGQNASGQLALGDTAARLEPTQVSAQVGFRKLACGGDNCCGLRADGALLCWGDNLEGKLGLDDNYGSPDSLVPVEVAGKRKWREFAVGQGHVCAIDEPGALYCWGRNTDVELGIGGGDPVQLRVPTRIGRDSDWRAVASSQHHNCAIRGTGSLYCWGSNAFLELAAPAATSMLAQPTRAGSDADWESVAVGWFHSCGIRSEGRLFCWGRAIEGQLGQASVDPIGVPTAVTPPERAQRVALGNFFTLATDDTGALYSAGANDKGNLGLGDTMRRSTLTKLP